ncbi:hypothetical protein AAMO2058_001686500 [Amorphochlora amoebiformis]
MNLPFRKNTCHRIYQLFPFFAVLVMISSAISLVLGPSKALIPPSRLISQRAHVGEGLARAGGGMKKATVIGGTGYVGSHIIECLLRKGYKVTATTRNTSKALWLKDLQKGRSGHLDISELCLSSQAPSDTKMDNLAQGNDFIFFCAGFEKQDPSTIDFMVENSQAVLKAARRQKVPCVVLTSSGGSTNPAGLAPGTRKNEILHWSDPDDQKKKGKFSPAAKTLMEINALAEVGRGQNNEIIDEKRANGAPRLCIINPNLILGPQLEPREGVSGNSLPWVAKILKKEVMSSEIPNDSMSVIDVRDLAEMHVSAAENNKARGRYFGVAQAARWEEILLAFAKAFPGYTPPPRFQGQANIPTQFDFTRRDSLGVSFRTLQETANDLATFFKERGLY